MTELEEKKLKVEIAILEYDLQSKQTKKIGYLERFNGWIKRWSVTILTFVSIVGGVWGLIIPIKTYYEERRKELTYNLNQQMVNLVNDLNDSGKKDQAIMMLQYYEMNSFDILLFRLERASNDFTLRDNISQALNNIYLKDHSEMIDPILNRLSKFMKKSYVNKEVVESKYRTMMNYLYVLENLDYSVSDLKYVKKRFEEMESDIPVANQFESFRTKMGQIRNRKL